jgi:hypothetical protein
MKKAIAVFSILAIAVIATFLLTELRRQEPVKERPQFNLTKPEKHTIKIDGKEYSFLLSKYDPPYVHARLLASREEQDLSTPEGTNLALWSSVGRDSDWYLSLFDEGARKDLLRRDRESGGRILEEYSKGKPLLSPQETGNYDKFIYKVELEFQGKKYAIIQYRLVLEGEEEEYAAIRSFVKLGDAWYETDDLREHPVRKLVGLNSYEEIKKILKEGSWAVP